MDSLESVLGQLSETLPPTFARKAVTKLTWGMVNHRTLANLDSQKQGPAGKFRVGQQVWYERDSFLAWLQSRLQNAQNQTPAPLGKSKIKNTFNSVNQEG